MKYTSVDSRDGEFDARVDTVELESGAAHLPTEFRQVALLANMAGIAGYEIVDVDYGMNIDTAESMDTLIVRAEIRYRRPHREPEKEQPMNYEVTVDSLIPGALRVEAIGPDGEVYVAIFSGPQAEERAREYAAWKNPKP